MNYTMENIDWYSMCRLEIVMNKHPRTLTSCLGLYALDSKAEFTGGFTKLRHHTRTDMLWQIVLLFPIIYPIPYKMTYLLSVLLCPFCRQNFLPKPCVPWLCGFIRLLKWKWMRLCAEIVQVPSVFLYFVFPEVEVDIVPKWILFLLLRPRMRCFLHTQVELWQTLPTVATNMKYQEEEKTVGDHEDLGTICYHGKDG